MKIGLCTQCYRLFPRIMILKRHPYSGFIERIVEDFGLPAARHKSRQIRTLKSKPSIAVATLVAIVVLLDAVAYGQVELGHRDLLYPDRLVYPSAAAVGRRTEEDPLKRASSLTTRAVITIEGRDQERIFTVYRASRHGHVEFGFPPSESRPPGSLEIFDATTLSAVCCRSGIRMVALRHVCSDSYLSLDSYSQMRACQLSPNGQLSPLQQQRHCLDGERMHTCTDSPYFYLDSARRIRDLGGTPSASVERYKLRFQRKSTRNNGVKVFYVAVTPTWEVKLRSQNSVIRRATAEACHRLWQRSVHVLFQRTVASYKSTRRSKRNFRLQRLCDVDPTVVRDDIMTSVGMDDLIDAVEATWRSDRVAELLATSVAWSRMTRTHKYRFVLLAVRIVKNFLRDSLLRVTDMYCLKKTHWGRMTQGSRVALLERCLTAAWVHRGANARNLVVAAMEQSIDTRTATFLIKEEG